MTDVACGESRDTSRDTESGERTESTQDAARLVLRRLDELVALLRSIDGRLQHLESAGAPQRPFFDDPEIGRPRRLTLTGTLVDAARGDLVGRAGAT